MGEREGRRKSSTNFSIVGQPSGNAIGECLDTKTKEKERERGVKINEVSNKASLCFCFEMHGKAMIPFYKPERFHDLAMKYFQ